MRLLELSLKNIGPFDEAHLEFVSDPPEPAPVTLITGENGTGKTIILDAIRGLFGSSFANLERAIWRPRTPFEVQAVLQDGPRRFDLRSVALLRENNIALNPSDVTSDAWELQNRPHSVAGGRPCPNWVVAYWRSVLATDSYDIPSLVAQEHRQYLQDSLQGSYSNASVTKLLCHFDYLRSSEDTRERQSGELLWETARKIVKASLLDGELSHIARSTFTPMVKQAGQLVALGQLSSGNAYLIHHLISLLGKMYAVHVLRETAPVELCHTPGLLLIDEAENHLHPRWQKRFIPGVLEVFPKLQIIATTHSPFIIASVPSARVYVCRLDGERCVVEEETAAYANKPVDEILLSPVFNATPPFNEEISQLLEARKRAARAGNETERRRIENLLQDKNPEYFSYLDIEERLRALDPPEAR